ncbi:DUF6544 family protein [Pacificoceanicola onchidii]|uniref:DUF6544 family protein n=1 Tax=Pacificoceanicola onchidii TaxID=2562685 RepID=UPI0010A5B5FA|nr:DUF6544 family protein [Pacificoceanicola onchidii]
MKTALLLLVLLILLILTGLSLWRWMDHRADRAEADRLLALRAAQPPVFTKTMVEDLPDPARRFFLFAIKEGTPLHRVAEISMRGQFGMGDKDAPNYMPMTAEQVLAAPEGFVWKMSGGSGVMRISGSDSASWTRFWLGGLIPVARVGGTEDHTRSGFGRYVAEAVFWTPAAVLPGPGVTWQAVDETTARLILERNGLRQTVDVTLDDAGRPVRVVLPRWSNANPETEYRVQPFGGDLSEFRDFDGFNLPTRVEAGNLIGTDAYFPFFIAEVTAIRFQR